MYNFQMSEDKLDYYWIIIVCSDKDINTAAEPAWKI